MERYGDGLMTFQLHVNDSRRLPCLLVET